MAEAKTIYRLSPDQLDAVRRKCAGVSINPNTTPLQAGFQLGVNHVIDILRDGFTNSLPTPERE